MKQLWSSLTFRLVVASLAWTTGLLYVAHLTSVFVMFGPDALSRFGPAMAPTTLVAIAIMIGGALIVRRALATFTELRHRLLDVHQGRERMVVGRYFKEVQPVVNTLNGLLEHQEKRVRDALAKAGDLAHGLKTPIAVLTHEAERASQSGDTQWAAVMLPQLERMRRHLHYHLAHARAASSGAVPGARCSVAESAGAIARTLTRLYAQRGVTVEVDVRPSLVVKTQREDLDEMLGNLVDNACKWARSRVLVAAADGPDAIVISVDDDGPGIDPRLREAVLQRGVRADETAAGTGLGLAIVRDLAELYGGSIALESASIGGARATLRLPGTAHAAD
jgi:signal transduction histidine kinase